MFGCQGDFSECKRVDYALATCRGFETRCKIVHKRYRDNHDTADAHFKVLLDEAAGKCWCVYSRGRQQKPVIPGMIKQLELEYAEEEAPKKRGAKKRKTEEEDDADIPDADTVWMANIPKPDWDQERKELVAAITAKKRINEGLEPEQRENFVRWVPDMKATAQDLPGWSKFIVAFTNKHYLFVDDERGARVSWEHRDPSMLVQTKPPL